jgi:hypothetical protein
MTDQTDQTEDPMRAMARSLFAKDASEGEEPAPPDPRPANFVQTEGSNPATRTDNGDMAELTRALFAPDPDA